MKRFLLYAFLIFSLSLSKQLFAIEVTFHNYTPYQLSGFITYGSTCGQGYYTILPWGEAHFDGGSCPVTKVEASGYQRSPYAEKWPHGFAQCTPFVSIGGTTSKSFRIILTDEYKCQVVIG